MTRHRGTPMERFLQKIEHVDEHWLWQGYLKANGYGQWHGTVPGKRPNYPVYAHRWIYEQLVGPIPEGYEVDHVCRIRHCVNPDHLEAITVQENRRRRVAAKTHCTNGHEYTEESTYWWEDADGYLCRFCIICRSDASQRSKATSQLQIRRTPE